jgi:hypothetical protein
MKPLSYLQYVLLRYLYKRPVAVIDLRVFPQNTVWSLFYRKLIEVKKGYIGLTEAGMEFIEAYTSLKPKMRVTPRVGLSDGVLKFVGRKVLQMRKAA